jgi:hypothetical protein
MLSLSNLCKLKFNCFTFPNSSENIAILCTLLSKAIRFLPVTFLFDNTTLIVLLDLPFISGSRHPVTQLPVTSYPVTSYPVMQLPVAPAHAITSGTTTQHHHKCEVSRYEQWNCESNLYRVTIDLLPHFPLLNCAVSRD